MNKVVGVGERERQEEGGRVRGMEHGGKVGEGDKKGGERVERSRWWKDYKREGGWRTRLELDTKERDCRE